MQWGHLGRSEADIAAGGFQHIGAAAEAGHLAVAVLGDVGARGRGGEGGGGGDIEELDAAAARAAGVDQVGHVNFHPGGEFAHGLRRPGHLFGGLALDAQRGEQAADLRRRPPRRTSPGGTRRQSAPGSGFGRRTGSPALPQFAWFVLSVLRKAFGIDGAASLQEITQQVVPRLREYRFRMKLYPFDGVFAMAHTPLSRRTPRRIPSMP